ncbi:MAG TPA: nucleotide exchange factor GrpE [Micromonosporaceae bacterium]|nr:nucleotide exchange factor GrpE [Micromonosporaceae bacterium]
MTEKPRGTDPENSRSGSGDSASGSGGQDRAERVVIRDKRKIDPSGGKGSSAKSASAGSTDDRGEASVNEVAPDVAEPASEAEVPESAASGPEATETGQAKDEQAKDDQIEATADRDEGNPEAPSAPTPVIEAEEGTAPEEPGSALTAETGTEAPAVDEPAEPVGERPDPLAARVEALQSDLDERTRDLQRVTAEYANYRKRVDRDRGLEAEQATAAVLTALLPVLDDLDRAREHGDLVGPFGSVAEQLTGVLGKLGLAAFGEKGDPFDPNRHEAVAHSTSAEVTEPTCVEVMRRGYLFGDRLLRAAMVAVADPE